MLLTPLFVLVDDLGVLDHVVGIAAVGAVWARLTLLLGLLVEHLGELVGGRQESLLLTLDLLDVAPGESILGLLYGLLYLALSGTVDLAINILQGPLDRVDEVVSVVADVGLLATAPILLGVRLGVADHLIDLRVRKPARGGYRNPLLLARPEVLGPYVDDAVSVNVERNLDLRYTPGSRRYADELKVPDQLVVRSHLTFTLVHLYFDRTLIVVGRSKYLTLTCRYSCIPLDELCHHATLGLDSQGEGCDVEEQHVLHFTCEDPGLDGGAYGHDLIGVDALVRLLACDLLDLLLNGRDAGGAADEDNLVHLALAKPASFIAWRTGPAVASTRSAVSWLNCARLSVRSRCLGPFASAVINGRLMAVLVVEESSFLAFSAASTRRWVAILSLERSIPSAFLNSCTIHSTTLASKSSPPRWLFPLVALTSKTPSPSVRIETSNVPPPRSKTRMVCSSSLSSPYARAAAVGSLMMRLTSRPAMRPASLVACLWASSK